MNIIILYTNDLHGTVDVFPKIATVVADFRAKEKDILLLDAGDTLYTSRVPSARIPKTEAILKLMAEIGYDVWTPGNRDLAPADSEQILEALSVSSPFPFLSANVPGKTSNALAAFARPYHLVIFGNITVGILGLVAGYGNPSEAAESFLPVLREKSDVVIGLLHYGSNHMANVSLSSKGFDLIVGGHSHEVTHQPIILDGVPFFQAGVFGKFMGCIEVTIKSKQIELCNYSLISLQEIKINASHIQQLVEEYGNLLCETDK